MASWSQCSRAGTRSGPRCAVRNSRVYHPFNREIFCHQGWRGRGTLFMGQRIYPMVLPRITGLYVDDADVSDLIRALVEIRPRPAIVDRHIHLAPARP